ncbi:ribonuclease P protein component [Bacillus solimangrovi]|uniref:Ribonuclease P protein component n=1 Tax=Bacillus solimangrovi TaxID=1305675 RepID=A0A1E5LD22_9BACI|nr:ribonuclease P protein component [Bacillus solimangrovi]OEH91987.1 ribonuclease P protein component [Bacillus solimangrovi]
MKKDYRIKKNKEFQQVFNLGKSTANRQFIVYVLERKDVEHFRIGLSVSKKVGNAVVRNQIKRYVRQVFLELKEDVNPNNDYVIIARKQAADFDFHETKKSLIHVLKRASVLKGRKNSSR